MELLVISIFNGDEYALQNKLNQGWIVKFATPIFKGVQYILEKPYD